MKDASSTLAEFLYSRQAYLKANLYEIILPGGGAPIRWTDADRDVLSAGILYRRGPSIRDGGVQSASGVQVDNVEITFSADDRHTINGIPLLTFLRLNGFDGAVVKLRRAIFRSSTEPEIGSFGRFHGRFSETTNVGQTEGTIIVSSPVELLNTAMPVDVYQASCLNSVYDDNCGLDRMDYQADGVVGTGSTPRAITSNLTTTTGYYDQGWVAFKTGANAGLRRAIKGQSSDGVIVLSYPLPAAPAAGDTFDAFPGCDLRKATCGGKFNNLIHFRGQPFIPMPEAAL